MWHSISLYILGRTNVLYFSLKMATEGQHIYRCVHVIVSQDRCNSITRIYSERITAVKPRNPGLFLVECKQVQLRSPVTLLFSSYKRSPLALPFCFCVRRESCNENNPIDALSMFLERRMTKLRIIGDKL